MRGAFLLETKKVVPKSSKTPYYLSITFLNARQTGSKMSDVYEKYTNVIFT